MAEAQLNDKNAPTSSEIVHRLLKKKIKCTLSDGRIVVGEMQCMDKLKNFILHSCQETTIQKIEGNEEETSVIRKLGVVMVPGKHLTKVEVLQSTWAEAQSIVERGDEIIQ